MLNKKDYFIKKYANQLQITLSAWYHCAILGQFVLRLKKVDGITYAVKQVKEQPAGGHTGSYLGPQKVVQIIRKKEYFKCFPETDLDEQFGGILVLWLPGIGVRIERVLLFIYLFCIMKFGYINNRVVEVLNLSI